MNSLGRIEEFNEKVESFSSWKTRFHYFLEANDVPETKYKPVLLATIGSKTFGILLDLLQPQSPQDKTFEQLVQVLESYFTPRRIITAERFKFNCARQEEKECMAEFATRLKHLAATCNFGNFLTEALRDRFICGLKDSHIQTKLIETDLSWEDTLQRAIMYEQVEKEGKRLTNMKQHHEQYRTNRVTSGKIKAEAPSQTKPRKGWKRDEPCQPCHRCLMTTHLPTACPFISYKCNKCHKTGHLAKACKTGRQAATKTKVQVESLMKKWKATPETKKEDGISSSDEHETGESELLAINEEKLENVTKRATIHVKINEVPCEMDYDSGAQMSIIPDKLWEQIKCPKLEAAHMILKGYGKASLNTLGIVQVQVTLANEKKVLPAAVVKAVDKPLFGLPWILAFELAMPSQVKIKAAVLEKDTIEPHEAVKLLTEEFSEVFSEGLGTIKGTEAAIHVKENAVPVAWSARRVPFPLLKPVEVELTRLVKEGVLEKVDPSQTPIEWATPTVNVLKGDGTVRICGDFRVSLNPQLIEEKHLMPTFQELTSKLVGGQLFTVIDLKDAYLQMQVQEAHRKFLIISTHRGYFRYKRLPFGLSSSPAIFQRFMENLLEGIPYTGVFLDDVIVTGPTFKEHLENLRLVLSRMQAVGLRAKLAKTRFLEKEVKYLGHRIDNCGVHPTEEKVEALKDTPTPKNVTELRSFLGAINFYERFIPNLHAICSDLHKLTSKRRKWQWTAKEQDIFDQVKKAISAEDTLVKYDENLPLVICCDASEKGLGAVLLHRFPDNTERPIAYASRTLTDTEKHYAPIDKEALALIFGVSKFRQYIYGRKFTLVTDHKPLERIFGNNRELPKVANNRLIRWGLTLTGYDFDIQYRKGSENQCADLLLRFPSATTKQDRWTEISTVQAVRKQNIRDIELSEKELRKYTRRDPTLSLVQRYIRGTWPSRPSQVPQNVKTFFEKRQELSIENEILMWGGRIVVPTLLRKRVLGVLHEGHPGIEVMRSIARFHVWWPRLDADIENFVKTCTPCQENQGSAPEVPLYSWNVPSGPWERIHIDVVGPFRKKFWLTAVDAFSKWAEVGCMKDAKTRSILGLLRQWFARFGVPKIMVSDNATAFCANELDGYCKNSGIRHVKITPYHPKSNGLAERFNKTFKRKFRSCSQETGDENLKLQKLLLSYRNSPQKTTGRTPAELFLGRRLPTILDRMKPDAKAAMDYNNLKQKLYHDRKAQHREFEIGDDVWVENETEPGWKPGKVVQRTGELSYRIVVAGQEKRKHADQLRHRIGAVDDQPFKRKGGEV